MIFVILGTQDKSFDRLLKAIDKQIDNGKIKEKVIVQAGSTVYKSKNMKIYDLLPIKKFNKYIEESDFIITHGGVGSILDGLKNNKKIIAIPRLSEYNEHENNHQEQIINEFVKQKYILTCSDLDKLDKTLEKVKNFEPKKYIGNNDKIINIIDKYIDKQENNKRLEVLSYLLFGGLTTIVNILIYYIFTNFLSFNFETSNIIAWIISVTFAFITNKLFVFENNKKTNIFKQAISFYGFRLLSLFIDMALMYLFIKVLIINDMLTKVAVNILVIIINYFFSKLFIFGKKEVTE